MVVGKVKMVEDSWNIVGVYVNGDMEEKLQAF